MLIRVGWWLFTLFCGVNAFEFLCPVIRMPNQFFLQEDTAVNLFNAWNLGNPSSAKLYGKLYHCASLLSCQDCIDCFQQSSECVKYATKLQESFNTNQTGLVNNSISSVSAKAVFQVSLGELYLG